MRYSNESTKDTVAGALLELQNMHGNMKELAILLDKQRYSSSLHSLMVQHSRYCWKRKFSAVVRRYGKSAAHQAFAILNSPSTSTL